MNIDAIEINKESVLKAWPDLSVDERVKLFTKVVLTRDKELVMSIFEVIGPSYAKDLASHPSHGKFVQKDIQKEKDGTMAKVKLMYSYRENDEEIETSFTAKPSEYREFNSMSLANEFIDSHSKTFSRDNENECYYLDEAGKKVFVQMDTCWIDEIIDDESGLVSEV